MKVLRFADGQFCLLDNRDFKIHSKFNWWVSGAGYAFRDANDERLYLHKLILEASVEQEVDHINRYRWDCRHENLRLCSRNQNNANNTKQIGTSSIYKGVSWDTSRTKWRATIKINGIQKYLGRFASEVEAAKIYDNAALKTWGHFSNPNFTKK